MRIISRRELMNAVDKSRSISQTVVNLQLPFNSRYTSLVRELLQQYKINTEHFHKKRKYERIKKVCPICRVVFETMKNHRDEKTTCSFACSNTFFRSGKNNGNYKPDELSPPTTICWRYHKKQCIICNESKIVEAHHYNEIHSDNRPENFVPLCPTHHQYWHSRYRNLIQNQVDQYVLDFKKQ